MKTQRNNTIEFYRFMFAINFIFVHGLMIFPLGYLAFTASAAGDYIYSQAFDVILPFMIFAGYFMMRGFKKNQAKGLTAQCTPARQAWDYLVTRIKSLLPLLLIGQLLGWLANGIWRGYTLAQYPSYFLACIGEFLGLQLSGIGMGNGFVGNWASTSAAVRLLCNTPMWFISGIFLCGYAVYYGLAKNENKFLGIIVPSVTILFLGSCWMTDTLPLWNGILHIGDFAINSDLILMFIGLSIGCEIWLAVDALKDKKWSKGGKLALTVLQIIATAVVLIRTWVSVNSEFMMNYFNIGWGATMIYSIIFCFLILLNVDYLTRCPITNNKLWQLPGKLSLYIYVLHFPILIFTAMATGLQGAAARSMANGVTLENGTVLGVITQGDVQTLFMTIGITIVLSIVLGYLLMLFNTKVLQPWIASKPWFEKETGHESH